MDTFVRNCWKHDTRSSSKDSNSTRHSVNIGGGHSDADSDEDSKDGTENILSPHSFRNPDETLVFLDWDDTLCPTTDLLQNWGLSTRDIKQGRWRRSKELELTVAQQKILKRWQESAKKFLSAVCKLGKVVILTNAAPGWVETCVECFGGDLKEVFHSEGAPKVVYARCLLDDLIKKKKVREWTGLTNPARQTIPCYNYNEVAIEAQLTKGKFEAMRQEARAFYHAKSQRSWQNIVSVGDGLYEWNALNELGMRCQGPEHEELRLKNLLLAHTLSVEHLTTTLDMLAVLLPKCVKHDGDLMIDLQTVPDPEAELARIWISMHSPSKDSRG
eukprot:TRINITY_DN35133_c0_g4_i1.p1 TRINITY_DN35133_c0_g4~~TRINITY_DN35133_c0_g4_i1.p1  ORF type:complete len:330 (+),score=63.83 TRINITY_DN35133_c0_g4_i1:238-1227(+)